MCALAHRGCRRASHADQSNGRHFVRLRSSVPPVRPFPSQPPLPPGNMADRTVQAVHGRRAVEPDPPFERELSEAMRSRYEPRALLELYGRFTYGEGEFDAMMRRAICRAMTRSFGDGVHVGRGVLWRHPETFDVGSGVFIGDQAVLQGRFDGSCVIRDRAWIGPQSYFDARDLVIEEYVGWGPGAGCSVRCTPEFPPTSRSFRRT